MAEPRPTAPTAPAPTDGGAANADNDRQLIAAAHSFGAEIDERAPQIEQSRRLPADLASRMASAGLFRSVVPTCYGGLQVHPQTFFDTIAITAQADGAVGWCLMIGATTGLMAASLPAAWAQQIYGTDPNTITSGVTAPIGKARVVDGGLEVSGRWPYGSGSQVSSWICGGCQIIDENGPRLNKHGLPQSLLVFFPADQVTIHEGTWDTSGLRGTGSNDIEVHQQFVPEGRWAELGQRAQVDEPLYRFPTLGLLALGVSAVSIGIARHAISHFVELATAKVPTGSGRTLAQRSSAQKDLARAEALVQAASALTREAIDEAWTMAIGDGRLSTDVKARLRLAASNNAWSAAEAVDLLYHAAGASAVYNRSPLQRCFRDVHVATQHIMVAQPTYEVIGKIHLGIDPKTPL